MRGRLTKSNILPARPGTVKTHGHQGWWPMRLLQGRVIKADGTKVEQTTEVFANMDTGHVFEHEKGWNGEPPWASGDMAHVRHGLGGSDELWESLRNREISGEITEGKPGRTVIRY